jgi:hypothetical protein
VFIEINAAAIAASTALPPARAISAAASAASGDVVAIASSELIDSGLRPPTDKSLI